MDIKKETWRDKKIMSFLVKNFKNSRDLIVELKST
jgi:hypothetical protein